MSAESSELLWETPQPSNADTTCSSQTTNAEIGSTSTGAIATGALTCEEDSLALDDWDETQEIPDYEYLDKITDEAISLMDARMAAPQGSLDGSCASHSWEHPASNAKRKRVFSYVWADRPIPEPPVGIQSFKKPRSLLYL